MAIHEIQGSFQELLEAEKIVNARFITLRQTLGEAIRNAQVPRVTPIAASLKCCVVSFSAIAKSKDLNLSAEYYIQTFQAEAVDKVLGRKQTASAFLTALSDMIHSGYAKVGENKTPLNDVTIGILRETFNNLNM